MVSKTSIYNTFIEKPYIKYLKNVDLLHELLCNDKLSIVKISQAFKRYARGYKIEIIDSKDLLVYFEATKSSIKDLFKDFQIFKFQTLKASNIK